MNFFIWVSRLLHGLPTTESPELIAAKNYTPNSIFPFEEIEPDLENMSSAELEEETKRILKFYGIN